MIELTSRTKQVTVEPKLGKTLLSMAIKHKAGWLYNCTKGTCARCRCLIEEGNEFLNEPTEAEELRLEEEELQNGYRLACQTVVNSDGLIKVKHRPYF